MNLLWISPMFPYPPFSGGQTRSFNLIKGLAKKHRITLFSFWRPNRKQGPVKEMEKYCRIVKVFPGRKTWSLRNVSLAAFSLLPFPITHFYGDKSLIKAIEDELAHGKYDLVHFESFYTSPYLKSVKNLPRVLGNENVEFLIYRRFAQAKKNLFLKLALLFDVWKMERFEKKKWRQADFNLAVSEKDARVVERIVGKKIAVIPNGVSLGFFEKIKKLKPKEPVFLFVGDFRYFTNQDAVFYLVRQVWPLIKKELPQAKLRLVGKNAPKEILKLKDEDVLVDEKVEDIRLAYKKATVFLAPMRFASGTNIKILEALAAELPIVTTPIGLEGIKARKAVLLGERKEDFAQQAIRLARDNNKQAELIALGKKIVKEKYDWVKIIQKLDQIYQEIVK